jgi:hypothetical protein
MLVLALIFFNLMDEKFEIKIQVLTKFLTAKFGFLRTWASNNWFYLPKDIHRVLIHLMDRYFGYFEGALC